MLSPLSKFYVLLKYMSQITHSSLWLRVYYLGECPTFIDLTHLKKQMK